MAKRTSIVVTDDLTGVELGGEAKPLTFALEGVAYEIDLSSDSAMELREALEPFIGAARRAGRTVRRSSKSSTPSGEQAAARAWLVEQGVEVPSRGRLSGELLGRYRER